MSASTIPVTTFDATGTHIPAFSDVLAALQAKFQGIFGQDVVISNDSQDGQYLALQASAINDCNAMAGAVAAQFSPATAQGVGLSSIVKTNGISREIPSNSQVDILLVGQTGKTVTNGIVEDTIFGYKWDLPASVTFPAAGQILVTATCETAGSITAAPGTVTKIVTPTLGWQSVTNPTAADAGAPIEPDPALRARQAQSVALPSRTVLDGTVGGVLAVPGVTRARAYENDTNVTDGNGIPAHSISLVIDGGDAQTIANTILAKKGPGAAAFGAVVETAYDVTGIPHQIGFYRPAPVPVSVAMIVKAAPTYNAAVGTASVAALVAYGNGALIGDDVQAGELYAPASLGYGAANAPFKIVSLLMSRDGSTPSLSNIPIAFNEAAVFDVSRVVLTVQ